MGARMAGWSFSGMVLALLFSSQVPEGMAQGVAPSPNAVGLESESPEVTAAFSRLDALAEELAERQRALGGLPGATHELGVPPETTDSLPSVPESGAPAVGTQREADRCAPREELAERMIELEERYGEHSEAIIDVNGELPSFRESVLDTARVCTRRLANDIASALERVAVLDLEADHHVVDTLTLCVDRLREETDDELSATTSNIRMQRLAAEMERLGVMTHRVADMERALLRGISKRDRLVQELGQFREEIAAACR